MVRTISPLWLVLALWGAGLGAAAQFGKIAVTFPLIADVYSGADAVVLGLIVSVVGFVGLIFGTTAGLFVQRLGAKRVLVAALVLGAVLSLLEAMLPPLPLMLALRVVEGVSHLAIVVTAPVLIAQFAPIRRQGLAMTLWSSFFGLTFALMAWIGNPFAEAHGLAALFLLHAGYMAGFAVILWAILPPDMPNLMLPLSGKNILYQHVVTYSSSRLATPAMGFVCYTITYVALMTLLPPLIGGPHQGFIATAMPLVSIAVSLTLGVWLLGRISAVKAVQLGFAVAVLAGVMLWLGPQNPTALTGAALVMAGALGLVQGASFAAIPQLNASAEDRSAAAGAIAQLGNLGTTSGTPLLAALIMGFGISGVGLFVIGFSLAGIAIHRVQAARR